MVNNLYKSFKKNLKMTILVAVAFVFVGILISIYYMDFKEDLKWKKYFNRTTITEPNRLVSEAISNIKSNAQLTALDLGAGNGSDTIFLLQKGFVVYSVDFQAESIRRINVNVDDKYKINLKLIKSKFEDLDWKNFPKFDIIVAINSISFLEEKNFHIVWRNMYSSLKPGGLLIMRLFGNKIKWPNTNKMFLLNKTQMNELLANFKVLENQEEFYCEGSIDQHAFNLILQK